MQVVWPSGIFGRQLTKAGELMSRIGLGCGVLAALPLFGCSGLIDPDPYLGTVDPAGFDAAVRFATVSTDATKACLIPRRALKLAAAGGLDSSTWVYLGGLTTTQLDISNAADASKALPAAAYKIDGCNAPEGRGDERQFDTRLQNYQPDVQYPVLSYGTVPMLAGTSAEPTSLKTYKPWHVVVAAELTSSVRDRMGCNDVKSERSLLERSGWDRQSKMFADGGPRDIDIKFPTRAQIQAGMVTFKDWPMVSVAVPVGSSTDPALACPFVTGGMASYPKFPGDPNATFQFPSQSWLRGLLGGYLDGGDLPVTKDPTKCPALLPTTKACSMTMPCDTAAGEVCGSSGTCVAPVPICPVLNELYVSTAEVPMPTDANISDPLPSAKVTLKDMLDPTKTRSADILAIFAAVPGQPGYSPVCRVRYFDPTKVNCLAKESDAIAPRQLCTPAEIVAAGAVVTTRDVFVHCLFLNSAKPSS